MSRLVSELTGAGLALWVARAAEREWPRIAFDICRVGPLTAPVDFSPHEDWAQGGPLIETHAVSFRRVDDFEWLAVEKITGSMAFGPTHLIAAMRAIVASVYGGTVPDEVAP